MISVGIDVSKGKSTVCILKPGGEVVKSPFDINHTADELDCLVSLINSFDEETRVVMEDTGHYHLPVASYLSSHDIFVCCVNALRMKKFCAQNIRRAKTDKIDAVRIASFGITYWSELTRAYSAPNTYAELRFMARQYYQVTDLLVKAKINFSNLLDMVMPEIQTLLKNQKDNHKLTEFVSRYVHFQNILDMGEKKFITDYCKWAKKKGYRFNERKASEIYALVQNGIPTLPNSKSTKIAVSEAIKLIHTIDESRNTILAQMQALCKTLPEYSVVKDMNCIGDTLAPRIIAEIGDVRRFKNKHSLIAYAGIDAPPYQSGSFNASERKISKLGNKYLRKTGYEIMQSLIRHKPSDNCVYDFIQKKRSEGKCGKEAMIAGLNKFLRVYYGKVMELYISFGGRGNRSHKSMEDQPEPPAILKRLGIEMRNAIVRNAKAKPIERTFRTVKEQFSKLFEGFCGGTILERPESLKSRIKSGKILRDYEIRDVFDSWIDGEYNCQSYGGSERCFKGMSRIDVWNKTIKEVRQANERDLNLMLMSTTRAQKIKRNGVYITICGEKYWYMNPKETIMNLRHEVFVRYDPADLRSVRLYDAATDKFMFEWKLADVLMLNYLETVQENVADAQEKIRMTKKFVHEQAAGITANLSNEQRITMIEMTVNKAEKNKANEFKIQMPKRIIPVMAGEEYINEKQAVGAEDAPVEINLRTIAQSAAERKEW